MDIKDIVKLMISLQCNHHPQETGSVQHVHTHTHPYTHTYVFIFIYYFY